MTLTITRLDLSAADLRDAAARTREAKAARRMLAIGLVLEGWSRESAAEACAMDRQTLCDMSAIEDRHKLGGNLVSKSEI